MTFWLAIAALTSFAAFSILLPLVLASRGASGSEEAVYRDQLAEIERDRKRGLIDAREAEAARVEIARRLLAAAEAAEKSARTASASLSGRRVTAFGIVMAASMVSLALYIALGSPNLPSQPLAQRPRGEAEDQDFASLIKLIEAQLAAKPDDGQGWDVIAPIYLRLNRPDDAVTAFRNASRLLGESAARFTGLGEALTVKSGGTVVAEAQEAFKKAHALAPKAPQPRYYLGLASVQSGDIPAGAVQWRAIVADGPADAPWLPLIKQRVEWAEEQIRTAQKPEVRP